MGFSMQSLGINILNLMMHIHTKSVRIIIQCHNKWDKMKNTYFQEKATKFVTCSTTTLWVWSDKMNKIFKGMVKANVV
jgi:hypothetical protein